MADFRKMLYAFAIVALIACFTVPASAQNMTCSNPTGTNQQIRVEGDAELVGDIVLACTGSGATTPVGQLVQAADITVSLSAIVTSKVINPGGSTPISEATLIIDDLKNQNCATAATSINNYNGGTNPQFAYQQGDACANNQWYPGGIAHTVCSDTSNPGGLGVCKIYAPNVLGTAVPGGGLNGVSAPQLTYDGTNVGGGSARPPSGRPRSKPRFSVAAIRSVRGNLNPVVREREARCGCPTMPGTVRTAPAGTPAALNSVSHASALCLRNSGRSSTSNADS